jgi:hypothetical protein
MKSFYVRAYKVYLSLRFEKYVYGTPYNPSMNPAVLRIIFWESRVIVLWIKFLHLC